jgi:hypothetical protein
MSVKWSQILLYFELAFRIKRQASVTADINAHSLHIHKDVRPDHGQILCLHPDKR